MKSREHEQRDPKAPQPRKAAPKSDPKPKLRIVKLEPRITPAGGGGCEFLVCGKTNHNETLVRDRA